MIMDESVKKLFAEYEKAFAELDFNKSAEFFADTFISAGLAELLLKAKLSS